MTREQKLERALLVIEGLTLEYADLENKLAGSIYTIAHGVSSTSCCVNKCPHILNHERIIEEYVGALKLAGIIDINKIQGHVV